MDATNRISQLLSECLDEGIQNDVFPGGVIGVQIGGTEPITASLGNQGAYIYDLASLTKVMATLPMILLSIQAGKLTLDTPVERVVPEFTAPAGDHRRSQITVRHLLTHSSGLPAWRPYFVRLSGRDQYLQAICHEPLEYEPGLKIVYSDLGLILLGFMLERIWDRGLDQLVSEQITVPAGMRDTCYNPEQALSEVIAPTEEGFEYERQMAVSYAKLYEDGKLPKGSFELIGEQVEHFVWTKARTLGKVHDANTYYGLNGISGHAGLFATMQDIAQYMNIWQQGHLISRSLVEMACSSHKVDGRISRGLGWEKYSDTLYGHTGFTGTSIWFSLVDKLTIITLTNRVHPFVREGIQAWRIKQRDHLVTSLLQSSKELLR